MRSASIETSGTEKVRRPGVTATLSAVLGHGLELQALEKCLLRPTFSSVVFSHTYTVIGYLWEISSLSASVFSFTSHLVWLTLYREETNQLNEKRN